MSGKKVNWSDRTACTMRFENGDAAWLVYYLRRGPLRFLRLFLCVISAETIAKLFQIISFERVEEMFRYFAALVLVVGWAGTASAGTNGHGDPCCDCHCHTSYRAVVSMRPVTRCTTVATVDRFGCPCTRDIHYTAYVPVVTRVPVTTCCHTVDPCCDDRYVIARRRGLLERLRCRFR